LLQDEGRLEQELENPPLSPVLEPVEETADPATPLAVATKPTDFIWSDDTGLQIVRATRSWIQYGTVGFAVFCIIIGAVEALLGR
jgi:hypothetical protein